ncbi:MAG: MlaD family protein [Thermoanaerobaculia bacterium]
MPRKERNEVLVGGFVTLGLSLLVLLFFLKGTLREALEPVSDIQVALEDVRGLQAGDPVLYLGSKVGRVVSVVLARRDWGRELPELFPGEDGERARALLTLRLPKAVRGLLRADSPVEIDKNLTGNLSVLIGEGSGASLPEGAVVLRGKSGVDFASIAQRVHGLVEKVEPGIEELSGLLRRLGGSGEVESAVRDLSKLAHEIQGAVGPLRRKIDEALGEALAILGENRDDLRAVVSNLAESAALARRMLERVEPAADELRSALAALERAAASVGGTIEDNRPGIDAVVEGARASIANAANITSDIRRRPWRLLYRPSRGEAESLDLYDAAWAYNLGAADLERSLKELTAHLEKRRAGAGGEEALRTAYLKVEESLRRHLEAEEAFWKRLKP